MVAAVVVVFPRADNSPPPFGSVLHHLSDAKLDNAASILRVLLPPPLKIAQDSVVQLIEKFERFKGLTNALLLGILATVARSSAGSATGGGGGSGVVDAKDGLN